MVQAATTLEMARRVDQKPMTSSSKNKHKYFTFITMGLVVAMLLSFHFSNELLRILPVASR